MKNHSQLQEDSETRHYLLTDTKSGKVIRIKEIFYFYTKRGPVFPSMTGRKGRQVIEIHDHTDNVGHYEISIDNVWERATTRKKSIYKFLRKHFKINNFESTVNDKFPKKIGSFNGCIEFVESLFAGGSWDERNIKHAEASDCVKLHFEHEILEHEQEDIIKALSPRVTWCKFVDAKTLHISYIPEQ